MRPSKRLDPFVCARHGSSLAGRATLQQKSTPRGEVTNGKDHNHVEQKCKDADRDAADGPQSDKVKELARTIMVADRSEQYEQRQDGENQRHAKRKQQSARRARPAYAQCKVRNNQPSDRNVDIEAETAPQGA